MLIWFLFCLFFFVSDLYILVYISCHGNSVSDWFQWRRGVRRDREGRNLFSVEEEWPRPVVDCQILPWDLHCFIDIVLVVVDIYMWNFVICCNQGWEQKLGGVVIKLWVVSFTCNLIFRFIYCVIFEEDISCQYKSKFGCGRKFYSLLILYSGY